MKKKRLLFINGHLNIGGVEKALLDILLHMDYSRYEVDLLLTEKLGDYASQLPPQVNVLYRSLEGTYGPVSKVLLTSIRNRDWFSFKMRLVILARTLLGQKKIALARKWMTGDKHYDCVIGFRPGVCTQLAAFGVRADRRITWWHHGEIIGDRGSYLEVAMACDAVAVVSGSCREMLAEAFPELTNKLEVIPNMLDSDRVQDLGAAYDPYEDDPGLHIVSVGRLSEEKHYENAVFVAAKLKENGIRFKWHLVGDGVLRDELRQKAAELDVADRVIFEGNQTNPYPYVKHADLFVHPSYVESFGIVVTEALALGVPCVVTESTGVKDFLRDGENALLTAQDPNDLAEKVLRVLCDDLLRERLRQNAHCPEQFLPNAVMENIEKLWET
jgi:glycosyltransferase involved in cell wall biosynthesis